MNRTERRTWLPLVADIVAVDGNPLDDITELEEVDFVMKSGEIVKDERPGT